MSEYKRRSKEHDVDGYFKEKKVDYHKLEQQKLMERENDPQILRGRALFQQGLAMLEKKEQEEKEKSLLEKNTLHAEELNSFNTKITSYTSESISTESSEVCLKLLRIEGDLTRSNLVPERMHQLYEQLEKNLTGGLFNVIEYEIEKDEYQDRIEELLKEVTVKKEFFKKQGELDNAYSEDSINIRDAAISDNDVNKLQQYIIITNALLLGAYREKRKTDKEYLESVKKNFNREKAKFEEAVKRINIYANQLFLGRIDPKAEIKELQGTIYKLWSVSHKILHTLDNVNAVLNSKGTLGFDSSKSIRDGYLKMFKNIMKIVNIIRGWKTAESGIEVEKNFAALQNILTTTSQIPGLHSLILSNYIIPMVNSISKQFTVIVDIERKKNDIRAVAGMAMNMDVEPGGRDVRDFMYEIWNDKFSLEEIVIKDDAIKFFSNKKEKLEKFIGESCPDPKKEAEKFKEWIRNHKEKIWILIYGNRDTPDSTEKNNLSGL